MCAELADGEDLRFLLGYRGEGGSDIRGDVGGDDLICGPGCFQVVRVELDDMVCCRLVGMGFWKSGWLSSSPPRPKETWSTAINDTGFTAGLSGKSRAGMELRSGS